MSPAFLLTLKGEHLQNASTKETGQTQALNSGKRYHIHAQAVHHPQIGALPFLAFLKAKERQVFKGKITCIAVKGFDGEKALHFLSRDLNQHPTESLVRDGGNASSLSICHFRAGTLINGADRLNNDTALQIAHTHSFASFSFASTKCSGLSSIHVGGWEV